MASALFRQLWDAALHREHVVIEKAKRLRNSMNALDWVSCGRLARSLLAAHDEFTQDLAEIVRRHRMRVKPDRPACPHCGDPDCQGAIDGAVIVHVVGPGFVKDFYLPPGAA